MRTQHLLFWIPGILLGLGVAVSACPGTSGGEGEGEGEGQQILDGGFTGEGEGEGEGAGEGEGEGGFQLCDGGLCPDGGVSGQEYTGAAEPGVKCDAAVCDVGVDCCVALDQSFNLTATCAAAAGDACAQGSLADAHCDGAEDCAAGDECCFDQNAFATTCVAAGTCEAGGNGKATVCVSTADCGATELCCGVNTGGGFTLPVDMGICQPADQNCGG